jgi:YCII-related domain
MSTDEAKLMQEHAVYWKACMDKGQVVAFGLVADAAAPYGVAIVEVGDEAEVDRLTAGDPVIKAERGFKYEIAPVPRGAVHPPFASRN